VPKLLYLSAADAERCGVPMRDVIDLVQLALFEHGLGRTEMPPKLGIHPQPGTLLHAMPALVRAANAAGVKWVSAFPQNRERGLPAVTGMIVLNDPETGLAQAIMDATWITAVRTAASTAVACRKLAPLDAETLAIIGPGVLGRTNVTALREVLPQLRRVRAYAPRRETVDRFVHDIQVQHGLEVQAVNSAEDAVHYAEVVVTAAPWPPVGSRPALGAEVMRDVPFCCALDLDSTLLGEAVAAADRCFADDVATFESIRQHSFFAGWPFPLELSQVVAGKLPGRQTSDERVICANLGLGIYDVVVARKVFEAALRQGIGIELPQ